MTPDGPIRTCVGCRQRARDAELLRVVVRDGCLLPDPRRRLPGRGAWLHPARACLDTALRRRAFERALRVHGPVDPAAVTGHLAVNGSPGAA